MHWSENRNLRSVNSLKLWDENPRLMEEPDYYVSPRQVIKEIYDKAEDKFNRLLRSISEQGWLGFDSIVVLPPDSKGQMAVVEGNRRVAALKLFMNPKLAPKEKRASIRRYAANVDIESIKKIQVCIAPSLKDAIFFISQRHTTTPVDKWQTEPQKRWLLFVLSECSGDVDEACRVSGFKPSDFSHALNMTQLHDYAKTLQALTTEEREIVNDIHVFPLTTFIRIFESSVGKDFFKLSQDEQTKEFVCSITKDEFEAALTFIVREIISGDITSRSVSTNSQLQEYITTKYRKIEEWPKSSETPVLISSWSACPAPTPPSPAPSPVPLPSPPSPGPNRRNRNVYKIPATLHLDSKNNRLSEVFDELKKITYSTQPNTFAVMLRVFLDLAVSDYIKSTKLEDELLLFAESKPKLAEKLHSRICFLLRKLDGELDRNSKAAISKFLDSKNIVSLDTLNFYVHHDIIFPGKDDLRNLWNVIYEFTKYLLDYRE